MNANVFPQARTGARKITVERCGREASPVVVIDNFSPDAESLIDVAEALEFAELGEFYPGPRAHAPKSYFAGVADIVAPIVKRAFGAEKSLTLDRALFSIATRSPADLTLAQRVPHIDDADEKAIAIVHYLARENFGGTAFYRHRSTGFETVGPELLALFLASLKADFARFGEPPPAYIDGDTEIFERILRVEARFNRAVIYRSNLLHCAELPNHAPLPLSPRAGRLTIAAFLHVE